MIKSCGGRNSGYMPPDRQTQSYLRRPCSHQRSYRMYEREALLVNKVSMGSILIPRGLPVGS
jgi:hypothetical protein